MTRLFEGHHPRTLMALTEADNECPFCLNLLQKYLTIFAETPRVANGAPFPPQYQEAIRALWSDPGVQQIYGLGHTYALADNVK